MRSEAADPAGGLPTRRQNGKRRGAGAVRWPHHRARVSRRHRRPPPPASKPPRARPRSVLSPMASASGAMAKHEQILVLDPPTDLKFKGRKKAAPDWGGAGGGLDSGRAVGVEGRSEAGALVERPLPHAPALSCSRGASLRPLASRSAAGPSPSLGRSRLGARASPGEAEGPGPGAAAAILRSRGGASWCCPRCCPRLALVLSPGGPSGVVWEGVGGR